MKETRLVKTIANPAGRVTVSVPARKKKPGKTHTSSAAQKRKPTTANPAYMITLGAASNPRGNNVKAQAKTKKKNTAARPHSHAAKPKAKSNPVKVVTITRSKPSTKGNPELFGRKVSALDLMKALGGSWLGAMVTRGTNNVLSTRTTLSPTIRLLLAAVAGGGSGMLLQAWDRLAAQGAFYGTMLATVTTGVDQIIPQNLLPLSGAPRTTNVGKLVDGQWSHPSNPVRAAIESKQRAVQALPMPGSAASVASAKAMAGVGRTFGKAF